MPNARIITIKQACYGYWFFLTVRLRLTYTVIEVIPRFTVISYPCKYRKIPYILKNYGYLRLSRYVIEVRLPRLSRLSRYQPTGLITVTYGYLRLFTVIAVYRGILRYFILYSFFSTSFSVCLSFLSFLLEIFVGNYSKIDY